MRCDRLALIVAAALSAPSTAFAHAQLLAANPGVGSTIRESPKAIVLTFSEGVEPRFCGVAVSKADGRSVPLDKPAAQGNGAQLTTRVTNPLMPGTYTVQWRAVSVDTHRTQGTFTFTVAP